MYGRAGWRVTTETRSPPPPATPVGDTGKARKWLKKKRTNWAKDQPTEPVISGSCRMAGIVSIWFRRIT